MNQLVSLLDVQLPDLNVFRYILMLWTRRAPYP